jgi:hypothetical protein
MQQVQLSHQNADDSVTQIVCWVDKRVNPGDKVTLKKDLSWWWTVDTVYKEQWIEAVAELNRGWNNNI